jgi:hypothetical protein
MLDRARRRMAERIGLAGRNDGDFARDGSDEVGGRRPFAAVVRQLQKVR